MITVLIGTAIFVYSIWAIQKIRSRKKSGTCCGSSSCAGCVGKEYCSR